MSPSGVRVAFELDRFEVTQGDRLEVTGRWSGVRGLRFMRPSLTVKTEDGERNLLALLEHKPWAAEEGSDWIAAFPWQGDAPDPGQMELAVAPSVVVDLAPALPARPGKKPSVTQRYERERKRSRQLEDEAADLRQSSATLQARHDQALAEQGRLSNELSVAKAELEASHRERDEARRERDQAVRERDAGMRRREATEAEQAQAEARLTEQAVGRETELERLALERYEQVEQVTRERDAALRERDSALRQRDKARREIEQAGQERDHAVDERNDAVSQRLGAEAERDSALGRGTGAPLVETATMKKAPDWLGRALALMAIVVVVLIVLLIIH